METLDLSRRGVLLNDEQLGPYPLEKLKRGGAPDRGYRGGFTPGG